MHRPSAGLALALSACFVLSACAASDPAPPPAAARAAEAQCPPGSAWTGAYCARTVVVNEVSCPAGSSWDGARCAGHLVADCPAGTRFVEGAGCVAELAFDAPPAPAPGPASPPAAPGSARVVDPWQSGLSQAAAIPPVQSQLLYYCGCPPTDLQCVMTCSEICKKNGTKPCSGPRLVPPPAQNTAREFDRAAAATALAAASSAAKACTGVSGVGRVRVVFAPTGKVSSSVVDSPPFGGTPQGDCIAGVFRQAAVPPFDGSPVAVAKSVAIP